MGRNAQPRLHAACCPFVSGGHAITFLLQRDTYPRHPVASLAMGPLALKNPLPLTHVNLAEPLSTTTYVIQRGDTCDKVAHWFLMGTGKFHSFNRVRATAPEAPPTGPL